jgi:hypothetical protein
VSTCIQNASVIRAILTYASISRRQLAGLVPHSWLKQTALLQPGRLLDL